MSSLLKSRENFKRKIAALPVLQRPKVVPAESGGPAANQTQTFAPGPSENLDLQPPKKKSKKSQVVYSQPKDSALGGQHTLSKYLEIQKWLKDRDVPQTLDGIERGCSVDIGSNSGLLQQLQTNPRVEYDAVNKTYQYKHAFNIRTKEDLLAYVTAHKDEGVQLDKLKDSYVGDKMEEAVESLVSSGDALVIRKKSMTPIVIYYNDKAHNTSMDKQFKDLWHSLKVPSAADLPRELQKAGLSALDTFSLKPKEAKPKKPKARSRITKITNTHLIGKIDLTKDYVPQQASR